MYCKTKHILLLCTLFAFGTTTTFAGQGQKEKFIEDNVEFAVAQTSALLLAAGEPDGKHYPRTTNETGELVCTDMYDWTSGFFPGSLWYLFSLTGETAWRDAAEKWTATLESLKTYTGTHDLGFIMYCSYGNAARLAPRPEYEDILTESAASLASRFDEQAGTIRSWNSRRAWNASSDWRHPVIIDNMMNLELLFHAGRVTGQEKYYDIAVRHAETTLKNHFRDDFTTFHVVDYDPDTGAVRERVTAQGYSDNSTWARGQAWAVYGFTMVYRETRDPKFLAAAMGAADAYLTRLPADMVPPWDFNAGQCGYVPQETSYASQFQGLEQRDASAAAIVCSALFELGELSGQRRYTDSAVKMLHSLASPAYRAAPGTNAGFILKHSTGSIPHHTEIDVPLVYADYYFLEALTRYRIIL